MADRYDEAVEYLRANPWEIELAWGHPSRHRAGCLFQYCTPSRAMTERPDGKHCGCLTMVRLGWPSGGNAWTDSLTQRIRADDRIPRPPPRRARPASSWRRWTPSPSGSARWTASSAGPLRGGAARGPP